MNPFQNDHAEQLLAEAQRRREAQAARAERPARSPHPNFLALFRQHRPA